MKKLFKKVGNIVFYLVFVLLIISLIAISVLYVLRTRELDSLNLTYQEARSELNKDNKEKEITIDDLRQEFQDLTQEVSSLRGQNEQLKQTIKQLQLEGYGTVSGKIFPFISQGNSGFNQYQRVCAESVSNPNVQVCRTVSALEQAYTLSVPVGKYKVYAEIFPTATGDLAGYRAYYTDYIACLQDSTEESTCNAKKLTTAVEMEIATGDNLVKVDPVDWGQSQ